ncbi:hypothetical protein Q669_32000 [Labrenzia sp. C1B10]|nr:hypothetical protein Q669_32000 [Labrenzia sp. C1B10]ERS04179.1 hypothetical protein Q675_30790 [Labrenzia sp. C1B70]
MVLAASLVAVCGLAILGLQIKQELDSLNSAPRDNMQWALAQLEVELLRLKAAASNAQDDDASSLQQLRRRFNIFFSRVDTLEHSRFLKELRPNEPVETHFSLLRAFLDRTVPHIDGSDTTLRGRLEGLLKDIEQQETHVRSLALTGVQLFAQASYQSRQQFSRLLIQTALLALTLILALAATLYILSQQFAVSLEKSDEIERSKRRLQSMINASLDGIVVADCFGKIIDFNPVAEKAFGLLKQQAIGQRIENVLIPERYRPQHSAAMERYLKTGNKTVIDRGRIELEALRADGSEFPVELSIASATEENGPIFIAYVRDIEQRRNAEQELLKARDEALAADKAKSNFLAIISHEMRTPLNGVLGVLELLRETPLTDEQDRYLETASASGEILWRHINDVLDLTVVEAGELILQEESFDLRELMSASVAISKPIAKANGNTIVLNLLQETPTYFQGDARRLQQILLNLLGNAAKFTQNGNISLTAEYVAEENCDGLLQISVNDTGCGISFEDQVRIFDQFVTLDPSYRRTACGAGLGLSICKGIIRAMNGTIEVDSTLGKGSRFRVCLPLKRAVPPSEREAIPAQSVELSSLSDGMKLKVLVVEDNEINRFVARQFLEKHDSHVAEAHNGVKGVELAKQQVFDLILMDISMPGMDGIEASRLIRAGSGGSSKSLIVGLTAHVSPEEQQRFLDAGMDKCLSKPLRGRDIKDILAAAQSNGALQHSPEDGSARPRAETDGAVQNDQGEPDEKERIFDLSTLAELLEMLPPETLPARLEAFRCSFDSGHADIEYALKKRAFDEATAHAHELIGLAAIFGATGLRKILLQLEKASEAKNLEEAQKLLVDVKSIAASSHRQLVDLTSAEKSC